MQTQRGACGKYFRIGCRKWAAKTVDVGVELGVIAVGETDQRRESGTGDSDRSPVSRRGCRDRVSTGENGDWSSPIGAMALRVNIAWAFLAKVAGQASVGVTSTDGGR